MTRFAIRRTLAARKDLIDIARYTLHVWGETQLVDYMAELEATIRLLEHRPESAGRDAGRIRSGLRRLSHKDHYHIFFRIDGDAVVILRILHQRRDWQRIMERSAR